MNKNRSSSRFLFKLQKSLCYSTHFLYKVHFFKKVDSFWNTQLLFFESLSCISITHSFPPSFLQLGVCLLVLHGQVVDPVLVRVSVGVGVSVLLSVCAARVPAPGAVGVPAPLVGVVEEVLLGAGYALN